MWSWRHRPIKSQGSFLECHMAWAGSLASSKGAILDPSQSTWLHPRMESSGVSTWSRLIVFVESTPAKSDPPDVLDRQKCLEALASLRHAKWFQVRFQPLLCLLCSLMSIISHIHVLENATFYKNDQSLMRVSQVPRKYYSYYWICLVLYYRLIVM